MSDYDKFSIIKNEFETNWQRAEEEWGSLWSIMDRDIRAYAGNTWTRGELNQLAQEKREAIELPIIRSKINWFTGYQRDNIKSIQIEPIEESDQETADQFSKILKYIWDKGLGQNYFNQAFEDAIKTGLSLFGLYLDFTNDPINGDIKAFRRGYNSFALDPDFEQPDLSDCSWAILRDFVTRDQAKQLLPMVSEDIIEHVSPAQRDQKFVFLRPFTRNFNNPNIITFDQYYRRIAENKKVLIDKDSGAIRNIDEMPKDQQEKLQKGLEILKDSGQGNLSIETQSKEIIEYNILLSGEVVFSGRDSLGLENKYPFVPLLCFFEPSIDNMAFRFQGIVRSLVDAQRIFNKRQMKLIDIMDKIIYGGTKYMLGAVDDPKQLLQSGARKLVGIQPGFTMDDVQDMQANTSGIAEILQYSETISNLFNDLAGINESLLGTDEGGNTVVSGRLAQVRTANGVRANRKIFDQLDFSQQIIGKILIEAIQKNYPIQKIQRILNEDPTEQFYDKQFSQYDAVIKQGIESQAQKDQYYFELVNLKREQIVDVPQSEIIRALPLVGKSDLLKAIEQSQQQSQIDQQKIAELEQQQKELINSQIEQNLALAQERRGRVIADIGLAKERASESEENRAQAVLARAKTIAEIQKMDQDQLLKILDFIRLLEQEEQQRKEQKEADITQESLAVNQSVENTAEQSKQQNIQESQISNLQQNM